MLLDPSLRPHSETRIWTQNSKYRMNELKVTIAETFFLPGPPKNPPARVKISMIKCASLWTFQG